MLARQNVTQAEVNGNLISFADLDHTDLMMGLQKKSEEKRSPKRKHFILRPVLMCQTNFHGNTTTRVVETIH